MGTFDRRHRIVSLGTRRRLRRRSRRRPPFRQILAGERHGIFVALFGPDFRHFLSNLCGLLRRSIAQLHHDGPRGCKAHKGSFRRPRRYFQSPTRSRLDFPRAATRNPSWVTVPSLANNGTRALARRGHSRLSHPMCGRPFSAGDIEDRSAQYPRYAQAPAAGSFFRGNTSRPMNDQRHRYPSPPCAPKAYARPERRVA